MRTFLLYFLLACLLSGSELAGRFKGDWSSNASGSSGTIQLTVKSGASAVQASEASFTLSGAEVKTKIRSLRVVGDELEMSYEFGNDSTQLVSTLKGKLSGDKLEGKYTTTYAGRDEKVDEGTFKTTLAK
jgi:hypothetical protein